MEEPKSYSIEKLNESNYRSWSQVVESHLDDQDLWEVVQGKDKKPERPATPTTSTIHLANDRTTTSGGRRQEYEKQVGDMDKEGEEGSEDDYIDNFTLGHDLCRRYEGPSGNVDDTRGPIQTKDSCHSTPTTTSVQHNEDDGRRRRHGETSPES